MYPKNLKKYPGVIQKRKTKYIFTVVQNNKTLENKKFPFTQANQEEKLLEVENYKKNWGIEHQQVKNVYHEIDENTLSIELDPDHQMLIDQEDEELMEKYIWYFSKNQAMTMIPKEERKDPKKRESKSFQNLLLKQKNITHLNGNTLDNRKENLQTNMKLEDRKKIMHYNRKKRNDNTSGKTGVYRVRTGKYDYWEVKGYNFNDTWVYKKYSIRKYGEDGAHSLACNYRNLHINESFEKKMHSDTSAKD